jgi:hypothetical protein
VGEVNIGACPVDDRSAGGQRQLQVPGEEVGVQVGLDHQLDAQPRSRRVVQVLLDVAARVDHDRPPGGFVPDQVGRLRHAVEVVLDELHRSPPSGPAQLG